MDILSFLQSKWISRRAILDLLRAELIKKNDKTITYRKEWVRVGDTITIVGKKSFSVEDDTPIESEIVLFNKPVWYVVSKSDPHNTTVYQILPQGWKDIYTPIGRLDKDSHGLLILTNDTKLISYYAHPRNNHAKTYIIVTQKPLSTQDKTSLLKGVMYYDPDSKRHEKLLFDSCEHLADKTYKVVLHWWKKRHIRRAIEMVDNTVIDLQRTSFWPRKLPDNLADGDFQIIPFSKAFQNLSEN